MTTYDVAGTGFDATWNGFGATNASSLFEISTMAFGATTDIVTTHNLIPDSPLFAGVIPSGVLTGSLSWGAGVVGSIMPSWGPWGQVNGLPTYVPPTTGQLWPRGAIAFGAR